MILGITGGSGSGKTTLLNVLESYGCMVLDCDAIYHQLLVDDHAMLQRLRDRFPSAFQGGILQRKVLGAMVFHDACALQDLNRITHDAIKRRVIQLLEAAPPLAAIDAIALFESGLNTLCDCTIAVIAPEEDRVRRLMLRDQITEDYARSRIQAQHSPDWFIRRCDYILENTGSESEFRNQCVSFLLKEAMVSTHEEK